MPTPTYAEILDTFIAMRDEISTSDPEAKDNLLDALAYAMQATLERLSVDLHIPE